jgi:hypothetical protein
MPGASPDEDLVREIHELMLQGWTDNGRQEMPLPKSGDHTKPSDSEVSEQKGI